MRKSKWITALKWCIWDVFFVVTLSLLAAILYLPDRWYTFIFIVIISCIFIVIISWLCADIFVDYTPRWLRKLFRIKED